MTADASGDDDAERYLDDLDIENIRDRFALMMHERLVALERVVRDVRPSLDPRITLVGTRVISESGGVFVRVCTSTESAASAWCRDTLTRLGTRDPSRRFDMWWCQHWSMGHPDSPFVTEALVETDAHVSVAAVAHAALDSLDSADSLDLCTKVEVAAACNPRWFRESIRAAAAGDAVKAWTWDPEVGDVRECASSDFVNNRTWTLLHGWLAMHTEAIDVWHPRSLSSSTACAELVATLDRVCS